MKLHFTQEWLNSHIDEEEPGGLMACSPELYDLLTNRRRNTMSFNFDFIATRFNAQKLVVEENAPEVVKQFILQGLLAYGQDDLVRVKATGHLFNNDHQISNAELLVIKVTVREPKVE